MSGKRMNRGKNESKNVLPCIPIQKTDKVKEIENDLRPTSLT